MENEKEILNMINQLDKQDFELSSDIKLLFDEIKNIEGNNDISKVESEINSIKESIDSISLQKGDKGDDGKDYVLTDSDKKEISELVVVPVVEKVIEKVETIKELPIITNEIKEIAKYENAEQIVEKINTLENVIDIKTIKDFPKIEGNADIKRQVDTIGNQVLRLMSKQTQSVDLSGYVPTTRTLTINGVTEDLSADRTWSVGTVTDVAALTLGTTGTDLSSTVATGTTTPVITLNVPTASATNRGALSSTDWSTFNSKESALTFSTGLTRTTNTITANLSTGVSGGQSVIGGTASGNNLTLSSTSNATKGKIIFGTSAYDEVNNRLGIGTTVPPTQMAIVNAGIALLQGGSFSDSTLQLRHNNENIGRATAIEFSFGNGNNSYVGSRIVGETASAGGGNLHFQTGSGSYGTYTTKMIVLKNGNVGIGTTTPGNLLSIVGNSSTPGGVAFNVKNSNVSGDTRFSLSSSNNRTLNVQVTGDSYVVNQKGAYLFTDGGLSNMTFMTDGDVGSGGSGYISFATGGYTLTTQERMRITSTGNIGIGITSPSAVLHLKAGTASAGTAPIKLTSGTNLTTPENGALEYDGTELYFTPSTTRYKLGQVTAGSSTIASGTYTPTLTGVTNVTSTTAYVCQYMRVGNVVTVSGKIEVTPTVNNAQTTIGVSLPIASNFANSQECGGAAHSVANTVLGHGAAIYADATNDRAEMDYFETHGASDTFSFSFTYQII